MRTNLLEVERDLVRCQCLKWSNARMAEYFTGEIRQYAITSCANSSSEGINSRDPSELIFTNTFEEHDESNLGY